MFANEIVGLVTLLKGLEALHLTDTGHVNKITEGKIGKIISSLSTKIVCALLLSVIAACDFRMDDVDDLEVGLSYPETLQRLSDQRVQDVIPVMQETIVIKHDQVDEMYKLHSSSGICLNDNRGLGVSIRFNEKNIVTDTRVSPASKVDQIDWEAGRGKDDVLSDIKTLMKENQKIVLSSCIHDIRWININEVNELELEYLSQHPIIQYHYPDTYSYTTLKFENQALAEMTYHWRPFEE